MPALSDRSPLTRMLPISLLVSTSYLSDLLEDHVLWPDKLLQELCRKISLQASGAREELVTRLRLWHVSKHDGKGFQGSNFYLLPISDKTVPSQYMSPYKRIEHHERRSILRKRGRSESVTFSTPPQSPNEASPVRQVLRVAETSPRRTRKKKKLVQFSPYNRVQLISPRKAGDEQHIRDLYASIQEGAYENSEDEGEEWARTVSNASSVAGTSTPEESPSSSPSE